MDTTASGLKKKTTLVEVVLELALPLLLHRCNQPEAHTHLHRRFAQHICVSLLPVLMFS